MRKRAQGKFIRAHKLRRSEAYLGARRRNKDEDLRVMRFAKTGLFSLMLASPSSPSLSLNLSALLLNGNYKMWKIFYPKNNYNEQ